MKILKAIAMFLVKLIKRIIGIAFFVLQLVFAVIYGLSPILTIIGIIMLFMFRDTIQNAWKNKDLQDAWCSFVVVFMPLFSKLIFKFLMDLCGKFSRMFLFNLPFSDRKYQEMCYEQDHRNDRNSGTVTLSAEQFRALLNRR